MRAYATAAVLADRQARPDAKPVAWLVEGPHWRAAYVDLKTAEAALNAHNGWLSPLYAEPRPEADAKDAARYRWLRRQKHVDIAAQWFLSTEAPFCAPSLPAEIDAAIDAAMLETPTKEAT
jgi:hypothetical protein